jgi:hypothetical protein
VEPAFVAQPGDDRGRAAHPVTGAVPPGLRGCLIGLTCLVKRTGEGRDLWVAPSLHLRPRPDLGGGVGRGLNGRDPGLEVFALIDVRDQRQQQRGPVREVQVQRLAGDADRAGELGHVGRAAVPLDQLPGRAEDPFSRA